VARDALGVYVHPDNPVRSLTLLQTKGLFTGRIGSWHKVGGRNEPVHVVVRSPSSGTQHFFKELVLDEEAYSDRAVVRPTTAGVIAEIRADRTAIGYAGLGWPEGVSAVAVEDVMPSAATASTDAYPLSRYLYLHTAGPPAGAIKSFVDFAVGPEGQRIVAEVGFVPLWPSD
jgi:phosphate transport system substrate-binding protein